MRYTAPVDATEVFFSNKHGATVRLEGGAHLKRNGVPESVVMGKSFIESALKAGCKVEPDESPEERAKREAREAEELAKKEAALRAEVEAKVREELRLESVKAAKK